MQEENDFEKFPGVGAEVSPEREQAAAEWSEAMEDVPEFNEGITDAAALINYGLNAAAREKGVEYVVQAIKEFDASGREEPIKDLFASLGIDTPEEHKDVLDEADAAKAAEEGFREGVNAPSPKKSTEGAFAAIDDMKELIMEVEGADPRYEELREGARRAQKGYFDYAVSTFGVQDLTTLFEVLAEQREKADEEPKEEVAGLGEEKMVDGQTVEMDEETQSESLNPEILKQNEA